MRVWTLPVVALGVMTASLNLDAQPSEGAMRAAFEASLAVQVRNALDFVAESGGPEALAKVQDAGNDRYEIRTFRKLYCLAGDKVGFVCSFAVDIGVRDGLLQHILLGRFVPREGGLAYTSET